MHIKWTSKYVHDCITVFTVEQLVAVVGALVTIWYDPLFHIVNSIYVQEKKGVLTLDFFIAQRGTRKIEELCYILRYFSCIP